MTIMPEKVNDRTQYNISTFILRLVLRLEYFSCLYVKHNVLVNTVVKIYCLFINIITNLIY